MTTTDQNEEYCSVSSAPSSRPTPLPVRRYSGGARWHAHASSAAATHPAAACATHARRTAAARGCLHIGGASEWALSFYTALDMSTLYTRMHLAALARWCTMPHTWSPKAAELPDMIGGEAAGSPHGPGPQPLATGRTRRRRRQREQRDQQQRVAVTAAAGAAVLRTCSSSAARHCRVFCRHPRQTLRPVRRHAQPQQQQRQHDAATAMRPQRQRRRAGASQPRRPEALCLACADWRKD